MPPASTGGSTPQVKVAAEYARVLLVIPLVLTHIDVGALYM